MKGAVPLKLYIYAFTRRRKGSPGNLLRPSKRPTDIYLSFLPWLTKPSEGVSGHPVRMPFAGITAESRTLCVLRIACPSI